MPPSGWTTRVVGGVERLALELVGQHGDAAVVLVADHAAVAVLAGDLPALVVERVAVAVAGRVAEDADVAVLLQPAQLDVVGDVAPEQVRPTPFQAGPSAQSMPVCSRWIGVLPSLYLREALVERDDVRLGVARGLRRAEVAGEHLGRRGHGGADRGGGLEKAASGRVRLLKHAG